MYFLLKLNAHFFLKDGGGEIGHPAAEEVGHQADQQIAHRQRAERKTQRGQSAGDPQIDEQLTGVDVGK